MRTPVQLVLAFGLVSAGLVSATLGFGRGAEEGSRPLDVTVTPSIASPAGVVSTLMAVTGPGLTASSTIAFANCARGSTPQPGWPTLPTPAFASDTLTVLVPGWNDGTTCDVVVTTQGAADTARGAWQWSDSLVNWVTFTGITPSLLPSSGGTASLVTVAPANSESAGDRSLIGATAASLTCGTTEVQASLVVEDSVQAGDSLQATVTPGSFAGVSSGTRCDMTLTLASGNTVSSTNLLGVWVQDSVPTLAVTPSTGPSGQADPSTAQWVTFLGTGLNTATNPSFDYCPPSNRSATNAAPDFKVSGDGTSLSVQVPDVPPGDCAVVVTLPASGSRPAGYTIASVPPGGGFTFQPPYQGPITIAVKNPHTSGIPNSGIRDSTLWISVLGQPTPPGVVAGLVNGQNVLAGVNDTMLVGVRFSALDSYDSTTHEATLTVTPVVASGNLYFSNVDISGHPPNPNVSTARYGFVEFTYDVSGLDQDLTLIDQIGLSMSSDLLTMADTLTPIPGAYRDTGCIVDIVNALSNTGANLNATTDTASPGLMRYTSPGAAPTSIPAPGAWTAADLLQNAAWAGIVGASKSPVGYPSVQTYVEAIAGPLTINDHLNDPVYGGGIAYTAVRSGGIWTLSGTLRNGASPDTVGPTIEVEVAGLYGPGTHGGTGYGVYGQDGPFKVVHWASDGGVAPALANAVKTIYRDLVAGFAYGYWGPPQGIGSDTGVNAQNFTLDPLLHAYHAAQPDYPSGGQYAWNVYDQVIRSLSNKDGQTTDGQRPSGAYGMPYSDTFVPSALSPNQQQGFAQRWNLTLGDPVGCSASSMRRASVR